MSKSKGNYFTLRDLVEKGIDPLDIRYAMLASHYASTFNFTFAGIESARKGRFRIQEFIYGLFDGQYGSSTADIDELRQKTFAELAADLHTPKALAHVFTFINNHNPHTLDEATKSKAAAFFAELNGIFDVWELSAKPEDKPEIPEEIIRWAEQRTEARKNKNFAEADRFRDMISKAGFVIKDAKDSYIIEKI
jgi:cysteinyl-tRNA synthetase